MHLQTHPDGHVLIGGARWHYPVPGDPTRCAVAGCDRVLGQQQQPAVEDLDEDLRDDEGAGVDEVAALW